MLADGTVVGEATLPLLSIVRALAEPPPTGTEDHAPPEFKDWVTLYVTTHTHTHKCT